MFFCVFFVFFVSFSFSFKHHEQLIIEGHSEEEDMFFNFTILKSQLMSAIMSESGEVLIESIDKVI